MGNQTDTRFPLGDSIEDIKNVYTTAYMPVIIFVVLNIAVGLTFNSLAVIFFSQKLSKSAFHYFVTAVSLNDVFVNFTLIIHVVRLARYVNDTNLFVCKLNFFLIHWFVGNSLLLIVAISVDRFRRVVFPFAKQIQTKTARNIVAGLSLVSLLLSVHYFYTCTITQIYILNDSNLKVAGHLCELSKEHPQATVQKIFHITDMLFHVTGIVFLIILYVIIVRKLVLLRTTVRSKIRYSVRIKKSQDIHPKINNVDQIDGEAEDRMSNETTNQERPNPSFMSEHFIGSNTQRARIVGQNGSSPILSETERRFSITAFVITVASVMCFVPYYVDMLINKPNLDGKSLVYSVTEMLIGRSYMLNSIVNPLIMLYFNSSFREFVVNTLCCLCKKYRRQ